MSFLISIHALLTESDPGVDLVGRHPEISIHALLTESDLDGQPREGNIKQFQSTLSSRRATESRRG